MDKNNYLVVYNKDFMFITDNKEYINKCIPNWGCYQIFEINEVVPKFLMEQCLQSVTDSQDFTKDLKNITDKFNNI